MGLKTRVNFGPVLTIEINNIVTFIFIIFLRIRRFLRLATIFESHRIIPTLSTRETDLGNLKCRRLPWFPFSGLFFTLRMTVFNEILVNTRRGDNNKLMGKRINWNSSPLKGQKHNTLRFVVCVATCSLPPATSVCIIVGWLGTGNHLNVLRNTCYGNLLRKIPNLECNKK